MSVGRSPLPPLGLVLLACLVAGAVGLPLAWDGSYYLFRTLNDQAPFWVHHRVVAPLLTIPVLALSRVTEDLDILRLAFNLPYAAMPAVALALSWLVVRRSRPELFVWPMLAVGAAMLPGRALFNSEALIAAELSWPLLLAALAPPPRRWLVLVVGLGAVVAMSHPAEFALLVPIGAVGAWVRRSARADALLWAGAFGALAVLNVTQLTLRLTGPEIHQVDASVAGFQLFSSMFGMQFPALMLIALAAWLVYRAARSPHPGRLHFWALAAIALATPMLLFWAGSALMWRSGIDFRTWMLPVTLPFFLLAWLDARDRRLAEAGVVEARMWICGAAAALMLLVIVVQSVVWSGLVSNVELAVARGTGCIPEQSIPQSRESALATWAITPLSVVLQGRDVHAFVASAKLCGSVPWPDRIPMGPVPALEPGWFRFR